MSVHTTELRYIQLKSDYFFQANKHLVFKPEFKCLPITLQKKQRDPCKFVFSIFKNKVLIFLGSLGCMCCGWVCYSFAV